MMHTSKHLRMSLCFTGCLILAGCSTSPEIKQSDGLRHTPPKTMDLASIPDATPQAEPFSRYGNPASYEVFGREYRTLKDYRGYREKGIASWYGRKFHGLRTSSGEPYDMFAMTAAHKTLPLPCYARITNLQNGRSVIVKINDRGPFHDNRLIDLSYTAAWKLGIIGKGTGMVEVEAIDPNAPRPEQQTQLAATEALPATPPVSPADKPVPSMPHEPSPAKAVIQAQSEVSRLFLQVGAFGNVDNAHRLKSRLETELKTDVMVEQLKLADALIYRVQVGPIANQALCDDLTTRLNGLGLPDARLVVR